MKETFNAQHSTLNAEVTRLVRPLGCWELIVQC
jgi:hypothetical protein